VKQAKDETLNILKVAAERVDKEADSLQFSGVILETVEQLNKLPNEIAIDALKAEYRKKVGE
jgi:hypothetical protein